MRTGAINDLFNLTSREFTIYKEPIKNINIIPSDPLYGYGDIQVSNEEISYTPVYQTFSGRLIYPLKNQGSSKDLFDNKVKLEPNATYIKMRPEAFNYLNNGNKTELIKLNNASWKPNDIFQIQNYMGLIFYYVQVEGVS